jgi:hypothetical protein
MERNVQVQNASAAMFDDEKTVQRSETKVGNREEIESGGHRIGQRAPGGTRFPETVTWKNGAASGHTL